jgi:hypothetical protein
MARNVGGRRIGAIRGRTQVKLPNGHYAKRDRRTGEIISIKADLKPYKNVIIEREPAAPAPVATPQAAEAPIMVRADVARLGMPLLDRPSWRVRRQVTHRPRPLGAASAHLPR